MSKFISSVVAAAVLASGSAFAQEDNATPFLPWLVLGGTHWIGELKP